MGVDSLQALLMAIVAIQKQLRSFRDRLSWEGSDANDGLPHTMIFATPLNAPLCRQLDSIISTFEEDLGREIATRLKTRSTRTR
jgi:hypothetical protein